MPQRPRAATHGPQARRRSADYEVGDRYRGAWGLYGLYDYIAPQTFHVSSTAAALGTTAPDDRFGYVAWWSATHLRGGCAAHAALNSVRYRASLETG